VDRRDLVEPHRDVIVEASHALRAGGNGVAQDLDRDLTEAASRQSDSSNG